MVCKKCKKRIKNEETVCPHCGAPQTETVSLSAINAAQMTKPKGKRGKKTLIIIGSILLALVLLIVGGYFAVVGFLDQNLAPGEDLDEEQVDVNTELPTGVTNIALFGLDNRQDDDDGRSDAIIILSVDYDHNKIKLTSIARDTLVHVDGYPSKENKTKITHAFYWGAQKPDTYGSGAQLAVKTLNQNFGLNITRYMYVNFYEFAELIDMVDGVEIDVQQRELNQLNKHIKGMNRGMGTNASTLTSPGKQTLNGVQALAYARLRKIDSDKVRADRQKRVLEAAFAKVKTQPVTKYPALIKEALGVCNTNMSGDELLKIASWAMTNSPEFISTTLPDDTCNAWGGNHPDYYWVYIMDMEYATARLHDFIYETNVSETMTPERYHR